AFPSIDKALEYYPSYAALISYRGYALTKLGRYDAGYREYLRAADLGFLWAQRTVAAALLSGRGVKQDREQAIAWLQRAAAKGDPQAMDELAQLAKGGQIGGPPPLAPWTAK